ncbi:MAG: GGDEF domain-containing protein [Erythrobacter sp.]
MVALLNSDTMESQATTIDRIVATGAPMRAWPSHVQAGYRSEACDRLHHEGQFLLLLGLAVGLASSVIDYWVNPAMVVDGLVLRSIFILPITVFGLFCVKMGWHKMVALSVALSQVAFAGVLIHLGTHVPPETAAQYFLATALLLGISNVIVPYSSRGLAIFNGGYIVAVFAILVGHGASKLIGHIDFLSTLILVSGATLPVAFRSELLRQRNFLLALRHRLASEELVEANRMLRELSERDSLTGMHNRRYFERAFDEGCKTVQPGDTGLLALMMIDLDQFKAFNDRHGHQAGDHCLRTVGGTLRKVFAENNGLVARYGGEEFIGSVLVKSVQQARNLGENLREAVLEMPGRLDDGPLVTTSVGVAVVSVAMDVDLEDIIEMADSALYSAKRAGRNRVELIEAGAAPQALSA